MCTLKFNYYWVHCGHETYEDVETSLSVYQYIQKTAVEVDSICKQCHSGLRRPRSLSLRNQRRADFALKVDKAEQELADMQRKKQDERLRTSNVRARRHEEQELYNIPVQSLTRPS